MAYIRLELSIHGLPHGTDEDEVCDRVLKILREQVDLEFTNDIEVEIIEHAGIICHDDDHPKVKE